MTPSDLLSRRNLLIATGALLLAPKGHAEEAAHAPAKAASAPRAAAPPAAAAAHAEGAMTPEASMARLVAGNARYAAGKPTRMNLDIKRRTEVAGGQHPFATILACADSRVAPEVVFDQGLGDLFVCRVAGNVVDDAILASIEYSVIHLGSSLIMVLGHERCGAVKATVDALAGHGDPADEGTKIAALANAIAPAVKAAAASAPDMVDAVVSLNAAHTAAEIFAASPPLRARVLAGKLKIVAARYDLDDGKVSPTRGEQLT